MWKLGSQLPGQKVGDFSEDPLNSFKLVKEGGTFTIHNNERLIQSGTYADYSRFVAFRITVPLKRSGQGQYFGKFVGAKSGGCGLEWAGQFVLETVSRIRVEAKGNDSAVAHIEYKYRCIRRRCGTSKQVGYDRRVFHFQRRAGEWSVQRMGGHMSTRF